MNVGIIQARTGSSRLPGKIMMKTEGKTMLEHMIERVSKSKKLDKIVIATTTKENDDVIVSLAKQLKIDYFRGSEDDVLDRYYKASKQFDADVVVRLCSDSPLLDGKIIDDVVEEYERLKKLKVEFLMGPVPQDFGFQTIFDDTCGNLIALVELNSQ